MASQLDNELCCVNHCWGAYEEYSIVSSFRIDDWTAELGIIAKKRLHQRTM